MCLLVFACLQVSVCLPMRPASDENRGELPSWLWEVLFRLLLTCALKYKDRGTWNEEGVEHGEDDLEKKAIEEDWDKCRILRILDGFCYSWHSLLCYELGGQINALTALRYKSTSENKFCSRHKQTGEIFQSHSSYWFSSVLRANEAWWFEKWVF